MNKSIFNAFYMGIFLMFARKIVRKISPREIEGERGRYVVIVTTDPVQAILGSFSELDDARDMIARLDDGGWGCDNVILDTVNHTPVNDNYDEDWNSRESLSVYSNRLAETGLSNSNIEELRRYADNFGQSVYSTTFPGITAGA